MTYTNQWSKRIAIVAVMLAGFGLQACGDDDSGPTPSDNGGDSGSSKGGKDGGGGGTGGKTTKNDGGGGSSGKGSAGKDGGGKDAAPADGGVTDGGGGGDCMGKDGCYSCEPKTNDQILNHCTEATCQGFDNSTLMALLKDGGLPPLPK
jgi:hypothetical protein